MNDDFDYLLWTYRAVFTQTDVGGGNIVANFVANERMVILYGTIGKDDYAADRDLESFVLSASGNIIARTLFLSPIDNVTLPLMFTSSAAVADDTTQELNKRLVLGKGEALRVRAQTPVQNETMTIAINALIRSWPPTVTTTGSGGTVTTTETYNKVI